MVGKKIIFWVLTIPLGSSLIQLLFDFQSNKFGSIFSSAVDVHFVINSEISSLFGWLDSIIELLSKKKNNKIKILTKGVNWIKYLPSLDSMGSCIFSISLLLSLESQLHDEEP